MAGEVRILSPVEMQRLADAAVPPDRAADWTHAVMDVGATLCRPQSPDCAACPAQPWCRYADRARTSTTKTIVRPSAARESAAPFPTTSRWLRGRILDRLRDARDGDWVDFNSSIWAHDTESVQRAVASLATEALVERDVGQSFVVRARLPLA